MSHTAIIGAGITGVTTAYKLLDIGEQVTLFDRHPYAAMETSFANGGQLSASNAEVWNHWSTVAKGLKWMFRPDAPLLVNPKPSWHKLSWFTEFLANIPHYRANTVATVKLALAARRHLTEMAASAGVDFDRVDRGILHFYQDPAALAHAGRVNDLLRAGGLDRRPVDGDGVGAIEPALQGRFLGGFHTPDDFTGDIHKYTRGLASAVTRRGGTLRHEATVTGLVRRGRCLQVKWTGPDGPQQEIFDRIIICGGVGSRDLAAMVGDRVNVYPVKGYSITVHLHDQASRDAAPWVSLLDDAAKIVTSRLGPDRFRVAGTAEFNGENRDIRADRIAPLIAWCRRHFPGMNVDQVTPWAGLRPMMPDMLPRVRRGRDPGVFYNTGHGHLGWTLSAITAQMTADLIADSRAA